MSVSRLVTKLSINSPFQFFQSKYKLVMIDHFLQFGLYRDLYSLSAHVRDACYDVVAFAMLNIMYLRHDHYAS